MTQQDDQQTPDNLDLDPIIVDREETDASIVTAPESGRDPVRDAGGKFVDGHAPLFTGFKVGQNRGGAPRTSLKVAIEAMELRAPELFKALYADAQAGNTQAAIYLLDRIYGRPKQAVDMDMGEQLTKLLEGLSANREA